MDVEEASGDCTDVAPSSLPVTVTNTRLVTVLVLTGIADDEGVAEAKTDCVTVAVLTTVAVETDTGTDIDRDDDFAVEEDAVPELEGCEEPVDEADEADDDREDADVGAGAAALNGTGVGTTVELGPGGGMPLG